jgi:hypothetical protein
MQTIEMYFNTAIEKHSIFKQTATLLLQEIPALAPLTICHRCRELTILHNRLIADQNHLFDLMEFMGPGILDTLFIGEFQRALGKSLETCNALFKELQSYKENLVLDQLK